MQLDIQPASQEEPHLQVQMSTLVSVCLENDARRRCHSLDVAKFDDRQIRSLLASKRLTHTSLMDAMVHMVWTLYCG